MLIKKVDDEHIAGQNESHILAVQEKLPLIPEEQLQVISGSGPIEIRVYEDRASDGGRMMHKISFAEKEFRTFIKR